MITNKQREALQRLVNAQIAKAEASLRVSEKSTAVNLLHWIDERDMVRVRSEVPPERLRSQWPVAHQALQRQAIAFARTFVIEEDMNIGALLSELRQAGIQGLWRKRHVDPAQVVIDLLNDVALISDDNTALIAQRIVSDARSPVLTASPDGVLYLLYSDADAVWFTQSFDGGVTWQASSVIMPLQGCDSLAAGVSQSALVVVWRAGDRIECARSHDAGKSWLLHEIADKMDALFKPHGQVMTLADGTLALSLTNEDDSHESTWLSRSHDGIIWTQPSLIADGFGDAALACGSTGTTLVAAMARETSIFSTYSADFGHTWSAPQHVVDDACSPCLTPKYGYTYLTFCHTGGIDFFPTKDNGHKWWRHLRYAAISKSDLVEQSTVFIGDRSVTAYVQQDRASKQNTIFIATW